MFVPKLLLAFCFLFCVSACKKYNLNDYKGDTGETGPNAEMQTVVITVKSTDWHDNGSLKWEALIFASMIDKTVINSGSVQVSIRQNGSWNPLPLPDGDTYYLFGIEEGKLHLYFGDSHGGIPENRPNEAQFKIVTLRN